MAALATFVNWLFTVIELAILVRVLFSWIRPDPYNPFVRMIHLVTDPVLQPLRRVIPPMGMLDITPIVALILLQIIQQVVVGLLFGR
jgi:YggT family protein